VRLRIPSRRRDSGYFTRVVAGLRACPAVAELRVNPATASVLIVDSRGVHLESVRAFAREHGLFDLPGTGPLQLAASVLHGARRLDHGLRSLSGGELDLKDAAFLALAGGALYQLLRGELLAPAATLGWYAAALLAMPRGGVTK
jgi:hypothetical protein